MSAAEHQRLHVSLVFRACRTEKKLFYYIFSREELFFCCFLSMIKCCISRVANTVARDPVVRWREMRQENAENNDAKTERYIYSMEHECGWDWSQERDLDCDNFNKPRIFYVSRGC